MGLEMLGGILVSGRFDTCQFSDAAVPVTAYDEIM